MCVCILERATQIRADNATLHRGTKERLTKLQMQIEEVASYRDLTDRNVAIETERFSLSTFVQINYSTTSIF